MARQARTAPADGTYTFTTSPDATTIDTVLYLLDTCEGDAIACDDDGGVGSASRIQVDLVAGQTVLVVVDGYDADEVGAFELLVFGQVGGDGGSCCVTDSGVGGCDTAAVEACVCAFDSECCDVEWDQICVAEAIIDCGAVCDEDACVVEDLGSELGDNLASGTNLGAGNDHDLSCDGTSGEDASFLWTAPADGAYIFDTSESTFDTALGLLGPSCLIGGEGACADDSFGTSQSTLVVGLAANQQLLVVVEGYGGATGDYQLDINEYVPDLACAIEGDLGTMLGNDIANGSTAALADDYGISCASDGGNDAIYTWTAPADDTYTFSLVGSSYDTALALSIACNVPDALCNDDVDDVTPQSEVDAELTAGTEIIIVIDGFNGATGDYTLSINPA